MSEVPVAIDYDAQYDAETLLRAAKIKRSPRKLAKVAEHLEQKLADIGKVIEENELDVNTANVAALQRGYGKP